MTKRLAGLLVGASLALIAVAAFVLLGERDAATETVPRDASAAPGLVTSVTGSPQATLYFPGPGGALYPEVRLLDDIDVPFIRMLGCNVQLGTGAIAPPGANMSMPRSPSAAGPRDVHV